MRSLLLCLLFLLPSCGLAAYQNGQRLDKVDKALNELQSTVGELKQIKAQAREQADVNKDGKLDAGEMLAYAGILGTLLAEMGRRKLKAMKGEIAVVNARVDHERSKRKAVEAEELEALRASKAV